MQDDCSAKVPAPGAGAIYTMGEAAERLRTSRRWLQDWLRTHPVDDAGRPFYSPLGRGKTFDENDLYRIREAARQEERSRLHRRHKGDNDAFPLAPSSEGNALADALRLTDKRMK